MGERVVAAFKHAAVGSVVAVGISVLGDKAVQFVVQATPQTMGSDKVRSAVVALGALGIGTIALVAGDQLLSAVIGDDDPLFRLFYYQIAFHNMQAAGLFGRHVKALIGDFTTTDRASTGYGAAPMRPPNPPPSTTCGKPGCTGN